MTTDSSAIETSATRLTRSAADVPVAGLGIGWTKLASAIAEALPVTQIERIWLFPPVRHEEREWGTAVITVRVAENRSQVHTGTYVFIIRGRERGQAHVSVEEVGVGPDDVLPDVIRGVQERAGEVEPPVEIASELWFPAEAEDPAPSDTTRDSPTGDEPVTIDHRD